MQAIVLAGGLGTRLRSVVSDLPKPMASINGKPFLEYILDELNDFKFEKVVLTVGYKKEVIMNYFGNSYKNIKLVYSIEDEPLGTGGCIKKALSFIDDPYVFVLNGDTMFKIDFHAMSKSRQLTIACKHMYHFDRYGEIKIFNGKVIAFSEKKHVQEGYINGGIYYMPKNLFDVYDLPSVFSLEKDFFEKYIHELEIHAFLAEDYFIDIGIPEDYLRAQEDFQKKKALFLDRDGIINIDYGHVHTIEQFQFTDFIFDLCKKYQKKGYLIFIITNQAGIGKGLYPESDTIKLNNYVMDEFKKRDIIISKIYYCPHKPEDHCSCRKPEPGLFIKAIKEFNIDPSESIAIGDKLSDLEAAYKAGVKQLFFRKTNYDEYPVEFHYIKI